MTHEIDELEALKVHHIEPEKPRRHLSVLGSSLPSADPSTVNEADGSKPNESAVDEDALRAAIVDALSTVYDPEIPVDIYKLGLIYGIAIDEKRHVVVTMTLTAPGCPVAGSLVAEATRKTADVPGVVHATVDLVFDPPWSMDTMSDEAKLELGLL